MGETANDRRELRNRTYDLEEVVNVAMTNNARSPLATRVAEKTYSFIDTTAVAFHSKFSEPSLTAIALAYLALL